MGKELILFILTGTCCIISSLPPPAEPVKENKFIHFHMGVILATGNILPPNHHPTINISLGSTTSRYLESFSIIGANEIEHQMDPLVICFWNFQREPSLPHSQIVSETRQHSIRMCTMGSLPRGGLPDTGPWTETPQTDIPPDRNPQAN